MNIVDGQEQYFENAPRVLPTQYNESTRVQVENVPGSTTYKQYTIQPHLTTENLEVNYQNQGPVYRNAPLRYNAPITNSTSQVVSQDRTFQVPTFNDVGVKVPVTHYVPEYHDVPIYVRLPPSKDTLLRNVREVYVDADEYKQSSSCSDSEESQGCAGCYGSNCNCFNTKSYKAGKIASKDIKNLFK